MPAMDGSGNGRLVFAGVHESPPKAGPVKDLSRVREPVIRRNPAYRGKWLIFYRGDHGTPNHRMKSRHSESWLRRRGPTRGSFPGVSRQREKASLHAGRTDRLGIPSGSSGSQRRPEGRTARESGALCVDQPASLSARVSSTGTHQLGSRRVASVETEFPSPARSSIRPDCGRRPGSDDKLAPLGLDPVPRRPVGPSDAGEERSRRSNLPAISRRDILFIELVQIIG
jgi:hypothetical protein